MGDIVIPIRDKNIIEMANLMKNKTQISKLELRKEVHPSFIEKIKTSTILLDYELKEYFKRCQIEIYQIGMLFSTKKIRDNNSRCLEVIVKNEDFKIEIQNDDLAYLIIKNNGK